MRCTRSPACVRLFLLARLSSGLGDRCRHPHSVIAIAVCNEISPSNIADIHGHYSVAICALADAHKLGNGLRLQWIGDMTPLNAVSFWNPPWCCLANRMKQPSTFRVHLLRRIGFATCRSRKMQSIRNMAQRWKLVLLRWGRQTR